jgi:hypothetical protein
MARVVLSYPHQEQATAERLGQALFSAGLNPVLDSYDYGFGEQLLSHLLYSVESSDFVLLLIPALSMSAWRSRGVSDAIRSKLRSRNVSIVPVFLGRRSLTPALSDSVSFSIERDRGDSAEEKAIQRIVSYLASLPRVQFDLLPPRMFEELVAALLEKLRFFDIERSHSSDLSFDIQAKTRTRNPFGGFGTITWLIEIKFHRDSRADISSLRQLSSYLEERSVAVNGVIITNGQLTSTAREWIESNQKSKRTSITIVDGTQLRELVLKYPDLVARFFGPEL